MIYIKVTIPDSETGYVDTPENAKKIIDELVQSAEENRDFEMSFEFKAIELTEEEFNQLPDFPGF